MKFLLNLVVPFVYAVAAKATPGLVNALLDAVKRVKDATGRTENKWDDAIMDFLCKVLGIDDDKK